MNVIATTTAPTAASTLARRPKRAKRAVIGLVGATVLIGGGVAAAVLTGSHGPSTAPGPAPALQQAGLVRADRLQGTVDARTVVAATPLQQAAVTKGERLQGEADARTSGGETALTQIHRVTGGGHAAQQARTRLYQASATAEGHLCGDTSLPHCGQSNPAEVRLKAATCLAWCDPEAELGLAGGQPVGERDVGGADGERDVQAGDALLVRRHARRIGGLLARGRGDDGHADC